MSAWREPVDYVASRGREPVVCMDFSFSTNRSHLSSSGMAAPSARTGTRSMIEVEMGSIPRRLLLDMRLRLRGSASLFLSTAGMLAAKDPFRDIGEEGRQADVFRGLGGQ